MLTGWSAGWVSWCKMRTLRPDMAAAGNTGVRPQVLLADCLRARESEQDAARLDFLECFHVQLPVALECVAQGVAMLGESGWIEDNQVVLVAHAVEVLKGWGS